MVSQETIIHLLPFTNKFALLVSDLIEPYFGFRIYYHNTHNPKEEFVNLIVKFISLLGINLNVIQSALTGGYNLGVAVSIIYFIFSYLVPNLFLDDLYRIFGFLGINNNIFLGFIFGIFVIILLDLIIIKLRKIFKKKFEDEKRNN